MTKSKNWGIAALKNINDGIITTNLKGTITFMNPVAETLTGWRQEEALDKDLGDVFNIINTKTASRAKNFLTQTIQEGMTIHQEDSIYLAKGSQKIPITSNIAPIRDEEEKIIGTVLTFRDISKRRQIIDELKESEENLKQSNRALTILNAIILATNESSDLDIMFTRVLGHIIRLTRADGAECHLVEHNGILKLTAQHGLETDFIAGSQKVRLYADDQFLHQVFINRSPLQIPDIGGDTLYPRRKLAQAAGYRSLLCVPIFRDEMPLGTLTLYSRAPRKFTADVQSQLLTIGKQLGTVIERARLYQAEREQRLLAETMGEVFLALTSQNNHEAVLAEILYQVQRIVVHSAANIMLVDNEHHTLSITRWRGYESFGSELLLAHLKQSLMDFPLDAEVIQLKRPVIIPDTQQDSRWITVAASAWIRSFVAVPLCLEGRVLGLLRLDSELPHQFSTNDVARLLPLASAAAIALEKARLYDQAQQELAERIHAEQKALEINDKLLILQNAGATIASSLDIQQVLDTFALEMVKLLGVKACIAFEWQRDVNSAVIMTSYGLDLQPEAGRTGAIRSLSHSPWLKRTLVEGEVQQITIGQPEDIEADRLTYLQEMDIKTLLILPMEFHQRSVGFIELMDDHVVRTFTSEEISFAQLLANQAASAIANAQLHEQVKKELAERRKVEKELRWVSAKNQSLINAIPDSLFYLNRGGKILEFRAKHNLPLNYEKLAPGINLGDAFYLSSSYKRQILSYIEQTLTSGEIQTFEFRLLSPEGDQDIEIRLVTQGRHEVLAIIRNITKRKRAEEALKKSEANLRAIFNSSRQAFILLGRHGEIQAFNKVAMTGAKVVSGKTLLEGGSVYQLISEEDLAEFEQIFNRVLQAETVSVERLVNIYGTSKWFEYIYTPVFADDGQVIGVCFSTIDIDLHKRAVDTLAASEERLLAELQSILFTTEALVSNLNLSNLLEFITTQARYLTNSDGATILLLDETGQHLEVVRSGILKAGTQFPIQGSLVEWVIKHDENYISNQACSDRRTESIRKLFHPTEIRSLLCTLLKVRNKPQGVLLIWSQDEAAFVDQNLHLIRLFANQAALAIYNANLHIRSQELAIEQERQRMARDLHDTVDKSFFAIGMLAQATVRRLDQNTNLKVQETVKDIHRLAQIALTETRKQIHHLQPTTLADRHLSEALKQFRNSLKKQFDFRVELLIDPEIQISRYQQENLYYIIQEALWNVVKHAGEAQAKVVLEENEGYLTLLIMDEGSGFVMADLTQTDTIGLRSIQERTEILGGSFNLQSEPGSGTRITVQIPL